MGFVRRRFKWVALVAVALIGLPLFFFFWYGTSGVQLPVEVFLPTRLSGAVRLHGLEAAWVRHWQARTRSRAFEATGTTDTTQGEPPPEAALQGLLEAEETWPKWVKKYGETQARWRLKLYQKYLFQALGEDAWIMLGEWGGSGSVLEAAQATMPGHAPAAGRAAPQVGLVVLLKGGGMLGRVGPLMSLAFPDYKVEKTQHDGVQIYEYKDKQLGRCVSFCQLGGWIVASWRQQGTGPLPAIIDQARWLAHQQARDEKAGVLRQPIAPDALLGTLLDAGQTSASTSASGSASAVSLVFNPDVLWAEYRQFQMQRQRAISTVTDSSLKFWEQRLQGVQQVTLTQHGNSLFNWDMSLTGDGPRRWYTQWQQEAHSTTTLGLGGANPSTQTLALQARGRGKVFSAPPPGRALPELMQLDLDLPFARMALPLAGYDWEDLLGMGGAAVDLMAPGLRERLGARLTAWAQPAGGRMGLALYEGSAPMFPDLLGWLDQPPVRNAGGAPAEQWRAYAAAGADAPTSGSTGKSDAKDEAFWVRFPLAMFAPQSAGLTTDTLKGWGSFADDTWSTPSSAPPGYLAMNFAAAAQTLEQIPEKKFKKTGKSALRRWRRTAEALELAFGGATLRIDADPAQWRVTLRTM